MNIPNKAVEAAAEAMIARSSDQRDWGLRDIRAAIEAAAPYIASDALRKAALELMEIPEHDSRMHGIRFAVGFLAGQRSTK